MTRTPCEVGYLHDYATPLIRQLDMLNPARNTISQLKLTDTRSDMYDYVTSQVGLADMQYPIQNYIQPGQQYPS